MRLKVCIFGVLVVCKLAYAADVPDYQQRRCEFTLSKSGGLLSSGKSERREIFWTVIPIGKFIKSQDSDYYTTPVMRMSNKFYWVDYGPDSDFKKNPIDTVAGVLESNDAKQPSAINHGRFQPMPYSFSYEDTNPVGDDKSAKYLVYINCRKIDGEDCQIEYQKFKPNKGAMVRDMSTNVIVSDVFCESHRTK